jgi:hypothetical protein
MKNSLRIISFTLLVLAFFCYGCKKEKDEVDSDTQTSVDNAQAENIMNEMNEIADQAVLDGDISTHRDGNGSNSVFTTCAAITVSIDSVNGSGTASIDFGSHFCQGHDTKYRKGLITVSFTGPYRNTGTIITITATNYFVGYDSTYATKVNGQRVVTNNGLNSNNNLNYSITASCTLVNYLNEQLTWNSTRNREWTEGDSTTSWTDDEYLITGSGSGKSFGGVNFTVSIIEPLLVKLSCPKWVTSGKVSLTPENKEARVLDYGDGTCDNEATVTIKDKTFEVTIR